MTQYQNPLLYNKPWQQPAPLSPSFNRNGINFNQQYYQSNWRPSQSYPERNFIAANKQRQMNSISKGRSLEPRDDKNEMHEGVMESTDDNWEHHYAHRDRRDLYRRIETTLPM